MCVANYNGKRQMPVARKGAMTIFFCLLIGDAVGVVSARLATARKDEVSDW